MASANSYSMTQASSSFRFQLPLSLSLSVALHGIVAAILFLNPSSRTVFVGDSLSSSGSVNWVEVSPAVSQRSRELWDAKSDIAVKTKKDRPISRQEVVSTSRPNGVSQGTSGETSSGSRTFSPNEFTDYVSGLRKIIDGKKQYPALSRRMGETGRVIVTLQIMRDGSIRAPSVKQASTFSRLNDAALATVSAVGRYEPLPESVTNDSLHIDIPIEFEL